MTPRTPRSARRLAVAAGAALALTALTGAAAGAAGPRPVSGSSPVAGTGSGPTVDGGALGAVSGTTYPSPADPGWLPVTSAPAAAGLSALPTRVVPVASTTQLTSALASARPGDRIELATGTYNGPFLVKRSGTADHPVVVAAATGASPVLAVANQRYPGCGATGPDEDKTVSFTQGASHWVLSGLAIRGGVKVSSVGADTTLRWQERNISAHDWAARRTVPGTSYPGVPGLSHGWAAWFSATVGTPVVPSQDIQLLGNTITGKGVFARFLEYGVVAGNTVTDVACGTGPAVWLANFSHGNLVADNDISRVATSAASHYMQEGVRLGNGSDFNVVAGNKVHDLDRNGRAFTTDQDASYNLFTSNVADNVTIGFNEQMSGWGNTWTLNLANRASNAAFSFRMEDVGLSLPARDTSSFYSVVTCNISTNSAVDLQIGAMGGGVFRGNAFPSVSVGPRLAGYWSAQGNRWNDTSLVPRSTPSGSAPAATGC